MKNKFIQELQCNVLMRNESEVSEEDSQLYVQF